MYNLEYRISNYRVQNIKPKYNLHNVSFIFEEISVVTQFQQPVGLHQTVSVRKHIAEI